MWRGPDLQLPVRKCLPVDAARDHGEGLTCRLPLAASLGEAGENGRWSVVVKQIDKILDT